MSSNVVFYINTGIIKFFQASSGPQEKLVSGMDVINTAEQNDEQISQTLLEFVKKRKLNFAETRVTVLIPRSKVILRSMVFPSHQEEEIRSMIDLQIGSSIPFAKEEVEIDFQILARSADGYAKVAVVIIPQEMAMRYWKVFSNAKIPVHGITVSSVGLWLLYQQQTGLSDKPGTVFDLDADHSEICLCYKTHWLTSREIPVGLVQMQQNGCAEILKQWELTQRGTGSEKLFVPMEEAVYLLNTSEQAHMLGAEISKIQNDLTVKEIDLTKTLKLAHGVQWPKVMTDDGLSMASLAGIAFSAEKPPINLTPMAVRQAQEQLIYQRQLIVAGIWALSALISISLALGIGFLKKTILLAELNNQLRTTKADALEVEEELQKVHDIEYTVKNRLIFSDLANEIYRLLPPQLYLVSIAITDENTLSFQGVASNSVDVNQFQQDMVSCRKFSTVNLDYVNKRVTPQGEVDYFKITCTLKPGMVQNDKNDKTE